MATTAYFTEDELLIKTGKMVKQGQELRARLATLEYELRQFAASWRELGREGSDLHCRSLRADSESLAILNSSQSFAVIARVPWKHFDSEAIKRLCGDIQETKESLESVREQLRASGISLA